MSTAHSSLNVQSAKMLKISDRKFPSAKVGDNVRVRVPDVDRGRTDPRSILAVIMAVENDFCKQGTEYGVLKQLCTRSEFTVLKEKLISYDSVPQEEKNLKSCIVKSVTHPRIRIHTVLVHKEMFHWS
jgi:hypothetical protein